jgi:hypothetical protein
VECPSERAVVCPSEISVEHPGERSVDYPYERSVVAFCVRSEVPLYGTLVKAPNDLRLCIMQDLWITQHWRACERDGVYRMFM